MNVFLLEHPRSIPRSFCNDIANTTLSSSLITASLRGQLAALGHHVTVSEGYLSKKTYEQLTAEILAAQPQILGVHLIYQWDEHQTLFAFLSQIKKSFPLRIVIYGYYPTFAYRQLMEKHPGLFYIAAGEPETAFSELTAGKLLPQVPGLCYFDHLDELRCNPRQPQKELDLLPHPIRSKEHLSMREINIEGSRGCYNQCNFCHINPYYGKGCGWRGHSVDYICKEIEDLIETTGKRRFYFMDPNFFGPGKNGQRRAIALASRLQSYDIHFGIEARVNDIQEESLYALSQAGLDEILIGLESGSDEGLKRLNKNTTVAQNEAALATLAKVGIKPNIGFIMFEPNSSLADIRANIDFLLKNNLLDDLAITVNLLYHQQILLQGTAAYQHYARPEEQSYHLHPAYKNREVCLLAGLMRRLSNCVFYYLNPVWQHMEDNAETKKACQQINDILLQNFLHCFNELEQNIFYSQRDTEELAAAAEIDIVTALRKLQRSVGHCNGTEWAI